MHCRAAFKGLNKKILQDYCRAKLGRLDSRIQLRSFEEVKAHNAAGQCWLILDGRALKSFSVNSSLQPCQRLYGVQIVREESSATALTMHASMRHRFTMPNGGSFGSAIRLVCCITVLMACCRI